MKKYIFILFAACLFASCNDGLLFDDYLNELGYEFEQTNLSALAVLTSADYWEDNYLENVYSTKPNCEGKIYKPKDHPLPVGCWRRRYSWRVRHFLYLRPPALARRPHTQTRGNNLPAGGSMP